MLIRGGESVGVVAGAACVALYRERVARGGRAGDLHLPAVEIDIAARGIGETARAVDGVGCRRQELDGRGVEQVARFEPIRRLLFEYYDKRSMRLSPVHPFDNQYGIRTSGFLPGSVLRLDYPGKKTVSRVGGYLGGQPSIIRWALNIIPHYTDATFLDLGCGKGHMIASV